MKSNFKKFIEEFLFCNVCQENTNFIINIDYIISEENGEQGGNINNVIIDNLYFKFDYGAKSKYNWNIKISLLDETILSNNIDLNEDCLDFRINNKCIKCESYKSTNYISTNNYKLSEYYLKSEFYILDNQIDKFIYFLIKEDKNNIWKLNYVEKEKYIESSIHFYDRTPIDLLEFVPKFSNKNKLISKLKFILNFK